MTVAANGPSPESEGAIDDPLEGVLDPDSGHGTFICGLIRQTCPDANILVARVMHGDGAVPEFDFLTTLNRLVIRQKIALFTVQPELLIDVLSLSLGYYHELPADEAQDHRLLIPLGELGLLGVTVVAAAGNDATARHMYPAGFAPHSESRLMARRDALPVISVAALNPNKKSIALFSNAGEWVLCRRPGAAVVSSLPAALNGSFQPSAEVDVAGDGLRATIDPDDFRGGFGTWSGTSFAAPILAGEIAQQLVHTGGLKDVDLDAATERAWLAAVAVVNRGQGTLESAQPLTRPEA
jgi:hypothetical protein